MKTLFMLVDLLKSRSQNGENITLSAEEASALAYFLRIHRTDGWEAALSSALSDLIQNTEEMYNTVPNEVKRCNQTACMALQRSLIQGKSSLLPKRRPEPFSQQPLVEMHLTVLSRSGANESSAARVNAREQCLTQLQNAVVEYFQIQARLASQPAPTDFNQLMIRSLELQAIMITLATPKLNAM